ncbi:peptide deformylase [Hamadaea tsunoensis]|uniref:peptide deformylase n=1 Tax=Hamadaea tsunoensis TaxID=53368 RepID=UPI0003FB441D|nr:peptide deformylase [Hamadaea tsunoensis]
MTTARPITHYGETVLHRPTAPVTRFDAELADLVEVMFASMYAAQGCGLAANQIGVDRQVFVYDCTDADGKAYKGHVVNPELHLPEGADRGLVEEDEGCLSVPGQTAPMARPGWASVTGVDKDGRPVTVEGTGQLARCLQHEWDHLQGRVYVDRLPAKRRKQVLTAANLPTARPS